MIDRIRSSSLSLAQIASHPDTDLPPVVPGFCRWWTASSPQAGPRPIRWRLPMKTLIRDGSILL